MSTRHLFAATIALFSVVMLAGPLSSSVMAHCDTMDGPVVKDAQRAIAERSLTPVLKWVREEDEAEVRSAFQLALSVRGQGEAARTLADRYFFETLIRIHRAGEGEGFNGLKPAGNVDPAIAAADRALADGNIDAFADELAAAIRQAVKERFANALEKREVAEKSVVQGREYVHAYVQLTHFVESAHNLVATGAGHAHRENKGEH